MKHTRRCGDSITSKIRKKSQRRLKENLRVSELQKN